MRVRNKRDIARAASELLWDMAKAAMLGLLAAVVVGTVAGMLLRWFGSAS
jgi:hypothetical protein